MKRIFGTQAMMAALFLFSWNSFAGKGPSLNPTQYHFITRFIEEAAAKERLDPAIIRAVISVESSFNYRAVSRVGAIGLMQIMPTTAYELGDFRALDHANPRANILLGSRLLRRLVNQFEGNLPLALAAYNAGPSAVRKYKGIPPYPETKNYVRKVLARVEVERGSKIE